MVTFLIVLIYNIIYIHSIFNGNIKDYLKGYYFKSSITTNKIMYWRYGWTPFIWLYNIWGISSLIYFIFK
jgi:hypothetical protein